MKTLRYLSTLGCLGLFALFTAAADDHTNAPPAIGIYDSRAIAYAHFWSPENQRALQQEMSAARAAKQAGDTNKLEALAAKLRAKQDQAHRQVFSTAPVDDALAAIKDRLPEFQKKAGVAALVSKWDEATLKKYQDAKTIDVTDQLVREFIQPTDQQLKTISSIEKSEPLSLEKCEELIRKGEI